MSGRVKDIDYLALSARIRGLIDTHLTGARMERFLAAKNDAEATAVLTECGYPEFRLDDAVAMEPLTFVSVMNLKLLKAFSSLQ